ncbi:LCP family protein [Sphaerisporangium sp. TRM90804]|uniref:LCP family protein n=1 Tax=Sphaerisporangium sp. TRM90804 TaxID=3031113 RepID=UPI002446B445|nr:LCP family protein [Sphaerisporangium sp. TRM90804]MDH2424105.1 LCP family protein [Sphaerisporangium sp. TRM90804]
MSAIAPGAAHLRAGRRRTGLAILAAYLVVVAALLVVALTADAGMAGRLLDPSWLRAITAAAGLAAVAWFALLVRSYVIMRPGRLSQRGQIVSGVLAGTLAVAVTMPFAVVAQYVMVSQDTLDSVFDTPSVTAAAGQNQGPKSTDPWEGKKRVNVLLLGGDWQPDRVGVRTDSINLASVDVRTGNTVLLSLPRNLENVRFPPESPLRRHFPNGFRLPANPDGSREDLLFSVWEYAETHPELFGGRKGMGPETLKQTIGYTLGVKVDWYALVNMWGLARIIDALGGLTLTVPTDVVFGKYNEGLVKAGTRKLRGADAMWFARSRTNSDDYTRMGRQRCVLDALLQQADPATVLLRFNQLIKASKGMFRTDIPRPMLEHLVPLALKVQNAQVTSVQFVPPVINTGYPDWAKIRRLAVRAIRDSAASPAKGTGQAGGPTASPGTGATPAPRASAGATPKASATGERGRTPSQATPTPGAAKRLGDGCS